MIITVQRQLFYLSTLYYLHPNK